MGLPQLDFRVPEATWFKSALSSRFATVPGLSSTGALAWPYKIAVVAVMALVACGTLVTFGSAQAETPSSAATAALPGTDEASPTVEGQVLPPTSAGLLNSNDLLSSLNLTDFSAFDTTFALSDEDDDDDSDNDDNDDSDDKKRSATATPKPTTSPKPGSTTSPKPTTSTPPTTSPEPTQSPEPSPSPSPKPTEAPTKTCVQKLAGLCVKWETS